MPKRKRVRIDIEGWLRPKMSKRGSVIPVARDELQLPRAIVTGKAHAHAYESKEARRQYNTIRKGDESRKVKQRTMASELVRSAGARQHSTEWNIIHIEKFQDYLYPDYQIRVFSSKAFLSVIMPTEHWRPKYYINLLLHNERFYVILSPPALVGTDYFCDTCRKGYHNKRSHVSCGQTCRCCHGSPACKLEEWKKCGDCGRYFLSESCFQQHKSKDFGKKSSQKKRQKISTCEAVKKCVICSKNKRTGEKHTCFLYHCGACKKSVQPGHECYMQPFKPKMKAVSYIFFDFESMQVASGTNGLKHEANLCCVEKVCDECHDIIDPCVKCGVRYHTFWKTTKSSAVDAFCKFLFGGENKNCVAFAHNMQGYDGMFILSWLQENAHRANVVTKGRKLMKLELNGVTVLDSLNFLPMALSKLPGAFGFEGEKGFFPYKFNSEENQQYKGSSHQFLHKSVLILGKYPEPQYYGYDEMGKHEADRFLLWYNKIADGAEFDFRKELVSYCRQDVALLRKGVMKFRQMVYGLFDINPFDTCATIASVCMSIYRARYMPEDTIAVMPAGGLRKRERQSVKGITWLKYISETENRLIQHAHNGGEIKIEVCGNTYKMDGQDRQNRNLLYEFHGCLWHGHPKCHPVRYLRVPGTDTTFEEAFRATMEKEKNLKNAGYEIRTLWECQLAAAIETNVRMRNFFSEQRDFDPMDPREALYGGRTNAMRMICEVGVDEKIKYIDVISMYPFICKYSKFPIKYPTIYTEAFEDLKNEPYFGVMKCDVLAPRGLLHPVLPYRTEGKLMFALCRSCSETKNQKTCDHNDAQRQFKGVWCTPEIYKALHHGYVVTKIYEVYHYTQSDTKLFNGFDKIKASGWPSGVVTDAEKKAYIDDYEEHEGVRLDVTKIERNEALRCLAKLALNSFWGKFGQRSNLAKVVYCTDASDLTRILQDPRNDIKKFTVIGENCVRVQYVKKEEFVKDAPNTNCVIAAFVTCYARLKLYDYLEKLGTRALYCDTDSIIYLSKQGQYEPPLGNYLGDMKDELEGDHIIHFVTTGPKSYSYFTSQGVTRTHAKGLSLGKGNCKLAIGDFEKRVKRLASCGRDEGVLFTYDGIIRDNLNNLFTKPKHKRFRAINDKLRVLPDYTTISYGY